MVLKNMSSKLLANGSLKRVLVIIGCLLFLFSFIFPFYHASWLSGLGGFSDYYWSFKSDYHFYHMSQSWFSDYWFGEYASTFDIRGILLPMFIIQLLTLALGLVSIRFDRRSLLFAPFMLSLAVGVLMTYAGGKISGDSLAVSTGYQPGYYLVYPSIAMFLFAFLLNEETKRRQVASRNTSIPASTF